MFIFDNIKNDKTIAEKTLEKAKSIGIEKLLITIGRGESHELNVHANEIDLFRTTYTQVISIIGYIGYKKGSITINIIDLNEIEKNLVNLKNIIESSCEDPANELAPFEGVKDFTENLLDFSKEEMVYRLEELIDNIKSKYKYINIEEGILDFTRGYSILFTSNGTNFLDKSSSFSTSLLFSSRKDQNVSSFNSFSCAKKDLKIPIIQWENLDLLLRQNVEHLNAKNLNDKFTGSIIFTPSSAIELISFLLDSLKDTALIRGTSIYKDKVGNPIASEKLNINLNPLNDDFVIKNCFTSDGFLTKPLKIVEKGVLNSLLLSFYGSLKTGMPRALNYGNGVIIEGDTDFDELIKNTEKGILLERLSGGEVSPNGDFSGVAKNSFFVKNGKIEYPINETMVSGNYDSLLKSINGISKEYVNDGYSIIPYIKSEGVVISGK